MIGFIMAYFWCCHDILRFLSQTKSSIMNTCKFPLAIGLAILTTAPTIYAGSGNDFDPGKTIYVPKGPQSNRPRIPSRSYITCIYISGKLTFELPTGSEALSVTIIHKATGQIWFNLVNENYPSMEIGTASGTYSITIITESGDEFSGSFTL